MQDTTDYKTLAKRVLAFVGASEFHLVETLAQRLAALLLREFGLAWVRLTINKPGAIRHARDVGVTIERRRPRFFMYVRACGPFFGIGGNVETGF